MHHQDHERDVRGMHDAARCEALTAKGVRCRAPAIKGKLRCHVHGGKGSAGPTYGRRFGDYSKANLVRDRTTAAEIKRLGKSIRQMQRGGADPKIIADVEVSRRNLLKMTQQKESDLVAAHAPTFAELKLARERAETLAYKSNLGDISASPEAIRDRALGAMLGLGVGEALGVTTDGFERDTFHEIGEMHGGGARFDLARGQWAGSTASALALMESLTFRKTFDERDFMERLVEWDEDGVYSCTGACIGMDDSTRQALAVYRETDYPIAGDRHPDNLSCGSLVRVAPVAVRYWNVRYDLLDVAGRQSRTTHGGPAQIEACRAFADILGDAIRGCGRQRVLWARFVPGAPLVEEILDGSAHGRSRDAISSRNNVLGALRAAIWCVGNTETFDDAVLLALNLGEAASVITAVTGQLAGAIYGASSIRPSWLELLAKREQITEQADALFKLSQARP